MNPNELIELLGRSSLGGEVESVLRRFEIRRRPQLVVDEEDVDGPVVETQDWVINSHAGIEFGFEDEASFLGLERLEVGVGPMLLTQIYLYGEHEGVRPYDGQLPFDLKMANDRVTVREKLFKFTSTRRSYVRDTWEFPNYKMTVSYVENGARIGFIFLMLCLKSPLKLEIGLEIPNIEEIIEALGKAKEDPLVKRIFSPFGLYRCLEDQGNDYIADFRENFGFKLRFRSHTYLRDTPPFYGLSHITFFRDREMGASCWLGGLPHNIEFDDSPEMFMKKMDQSPDNVIDEFFVGYALWHLVDYSIRVKYSTMENCVLSVDLLAPGIWDSYSSGL